MGKKSSESSSKYREWERERRERLNVSFNDLGSLLPNHDPAISTSKVEILQKSAAYIRDLKKENSDLLLAGSNKIQSKKIKRFQRYVEVLLLRVQQMAKLLRDAGISLPPEPPSITPLGERTLRWSNKLTSKDAEKALESEKSNTNTSQKKAKPSKKPVKKNVSASPEKKSSPTKGDSSSKSDSPSSTNKKSNAVDSTAAGNKAKSSPQRTDKESAIIPVPSADRPPQDNGTSVPVRQLFGDTSHILTSLPSHVVGSDQQPGIIVIRTTGANTLGAVTQQPPQSTCFVIDNGNCGSVNSGQTNTIVASHPPTLESRPTFVLASNGSLLPVLPAPQFVTQPRQLIVSTSSQPVSAPTKTLAPIAYNPNSSNSQCIKPKNGALREVKCSPVLNGDISMLKKVPIPALPRNKQKLTPSSKDGTEAPGKSAAKKKCVGGTNEAAKGAKNTNAKIAEKKNVKSASENKAQDELAPASQSLPQSNFAKSSDELSHERNKNNSSVNSKQLSVETVADSRKRELCETGGGDSTHPKRRKTENPGKDNESDLTITRGELKSASSMMGGINADAHIGNAENITNSSYISLTGSVSSYSIDALCKMNEKISASGSNESLKAVIPPRKEDTHLNKTNSDPKTADQTVEKSCHSEKDHSKQSLVSEILSKSHASADTINASPVDGDRASDVGTKTLNTPNKDVNGGNIMPTATPAESSSVEMEKTNLVGNEPIITSENSGFVASEVDALSKKAEDRSLSIDCENKGKGDIQSSILPMFGSSPGFLNSSDDSYRKDGEGRENNCEPTPMDESSLPPGTFSSDLFASLQVPSGHSESISPTAAFLLAFPLVSTLTGKTPDLGSDNHPSQPLTSLDGGSGDNDLSSGGCGSSFLQLGNLEENMPSSSSQSILSSLSTSNPVSSQSTLLHLKSASTIQSLIPRSIEHDYDHETIHSSDMHLVERQDSPSKVSSSKGMVSKDVSLIPPSSKASSEVHSSARSSAAKETAVPVASIESSSMKVQSLKENCSESNSITNRNTSVRESVNTNSITHSSQTQKSPSVENSLVNIPTQNEGELINPAISKLNSNPCPNNPFEMTSRSANTKKSAVESRMFPSSDQQYVPYQLPNLACSSSDLGDHHTLSGGGPRNTGEVNTSRSLRQEMQVMDHATVLLPQNQPPPTFTHVNHNYKTAEPRLSMEAKQSQGEEHVYSSNNYPIINPPSSLPPAASSTSCFTISSFTSSFPSSASNSLLSSCTVTNSSPSFSSANAGPLLMTSSASTSSTTFPTHSNALYNNSSSSCIPPIYSNTLAPSMCTSTTTSFSNSTFTTVSESVITSVASSKTTASSKTSVSSNTAASSTNVVNSYGNHNSNSLSNMLPVSFVSSASTVTYGSNPKMISQLGSSSHQQCSQPSKTSSTVAEQKCHNHGHSNSMHPQMSESMKSNNIFSIDQLNNQNYCYNFNDYPSHVPSYMPQKPELEMAAKKLPNPPAETIGGNITSRMPGSFSVAHNSSNFSILSWTTLSPMSAAPSSSIDPQQNNMNGKADAYSAIHATHLMPSSENGPSAAEKVSDPNASSFPPSALPENREISSSYSQYTVGNNNGGMGTELNTLSGYPMPQDVGKQTVSRGHGSKTRQQVTNWMTAPDPIHSSTDFSHNGDNINNDHVRDAFGTSSISYGSNSSFYGHSNQNNMPYASSNVSSGANTMLDRRSGVQSATLGSNRNPQKTCSNMSDSCTPLVANSLHLQPKPQERQQNQTAPCTYNKMANSNSNYMHNSQNDLPALPTLVGDLALGSCNSMKGFLPIYDENNSGIVKSGKQDMVKVQQSNVNSANCGNTMSHKESRDGRNASSNHEYGGSSFLSVSQLVDHVKDTNQQSQPRDSDRLGTEKVRSREANKTVQASRRNVSCQSRRQSHVKRDAVGSAKEQHDSAQIYNSQIPPQSAQTFTNQGITSSVVSSNPTHLHAPPIPFPPYKSVHWPVNDMTKVTDNSRNTANYKSSSSYSAEALIRPCLSTAALDSRLSDIDMSYGMDIHKFPLPSGRSDHIFAEFVESNAIVGNVDNVCQQQHHSKQNSGDHRQGNENFRPSDQSNCDKFNYPSNAAPSTFHSHHHHHPHIPPSFGNNEEYSVETGNPASSLGLATNGMDFAPFPHSKETGTIPSSISNACAPIGYSAPPNSSGGVIPNQSQQCRAQEGKASMRSTGRNCEKVCNPPSSAMQIVSSKLDGGGEGNSKQVTKEMGVNHSSRSIPPFLSMDSNASSYLGHHYHSHNHHNHTPHYSSGHPMGAAAIPPLNEPEHQSAKLFPCFPPPASGMNHLPHQSVQANPSMGSGNASGNNLSSGTLTNFNLSTIFPEINDKQTHHNHMASSTSSFETSSKNSKLCTVTSSAPILHPPSPLPTSYHHYRPHQHNHQPFAPPVDLGNRLPPPHPPSSVLHSNVSFNNLMVQSSPQVNGIGINAPLQPPPPPFSTPSFGNVLPGI